MTLLTTAHQHLQECDECRCPICGQYHQQYEPETDTYSRADEAIHQAAHCCLWKNYDHAARVRIAERVEAGANWADAIDGESK